MANLTNIELEQGILSTIIWDNTIRFSVATDGLTPECFSDPKYRRLFLTLSKMVEEGISIYEPTLVVDAYNRLDASQPSIGRVGDKSEPLTLAEYVSLVSSSPNRLDIAENIPQYVRVLIDYANRRRAQSIYRTALEKTADFTQDYDDTTSTTIRQLMDCSSVNDQAVTSFGEAQDKVLLGINDNITGTSQTSFATGIKSLDICGGFHPGNLIVIAALSSHGKTALATTIAMNIINVDAKVAFYSLEMTSRELMSRIMARFCGVASNRLMYAKLSDEEQEKVNRCLNESKAYKDRMFFYEMKGTSVESISQSIRALHAKEGVNVVVIDYLQILGLKAAKGQTRESVVAAAARDFKNLADRLGIIIILLSQMNRDTSLGRAPSVNRIRDSGEINESADVTLVLYRPEQEDDSTLSYPGRYKDVDTRGTALVTVAKDRNGGTGGPHDFILGFNPQLTFFHDLQQLPTKQQNAISSQHPW